MSTYQQLYDDIVAWTMRDDLDEYVQTFIRLAEAGINRKLRTRQMVRRSQLVATDRYVKLPGDWLKAWNIQRASDAYPLDYQSPVELDKRRYMLNQNPGQETDVGVYYSLFGDSLELFPSPSEDNPVTIEMLYYARIPALTDQAPENWLLSEHYDIYLFGALLQTAPFLKEDERLAVWQTLFESAIAEANAEDANARRSGAPMTRPNRSF